MTQNRALFLKDPTTFAIPNDGVASVEYPQTPEQWQVLRYELSSFVCEGEYHTGLQRILSTYLAHLGRQKQPAVWVSGFYGSGKSHLVRMLEHFWRNVTFPDGAEARSLANLPEDIGALLSQLSTAGAQHGGLWAAAGKLSSGADSIRLDVLRIVFRSAGLPTEYAPARFVLWLRRKGLYADVVDRVEAQGVNFARELRDMYVSPILAQSLLDVYPALAENQREARSLLKAQYPQQKEISNEEMVQTIEAVLELQSEKTGQLPCTLLIFDELQQAIGESPARALEVQNMLEDLSSRFGARLLVVATGQSAIQAMPQLSKLQDRFTVRVELSDTDVEKVVRRVVLRKDQTKIAQLKQSLERASGEIDRHLSGSKIAASIADKVHLVSDYPLLPTRRRFWERVLRAIDTGTAAQLRTQLRMVHEATRTVAYEPVGTVVSGDFIYAQQKPAMLQSGILLGDLAAIIEEQNDGTPAGALRSRLCATIFLIGKLPTSGAVVTGLKANAGTLADLLVTDLNAGSAALRQQIPQILTELTETGTLMQVEDEYRLQTRESAEWEADFRRRLATIKADVVRINSDRDTALREAVANTTKNIRLLHGVNKTPRKIDLHFGDTLPTADTSSIPVWVQHEWAVTEKAVREEAQLAGAESPVVFVLLPRLQSDALTEAIATLAAATATLNAHPAPQTTPEGMEARHAMLTRQELARNKLQELVAGVLHNARVYQGGGNELAAASLEASMQQAAENSLSRLFPHFGVADVPGWGLVVKRVGEGAADALTAAGYDGDVDRHPASVAILNYVGGAGQDGSMVRRHFTGVGYGWPQDAVDGLLLTLLAGGFLRATRSGEPVTARQTPQSQIGLTRFYREGVTITATQKVQMRGFIAELGLPVKSGEEMDALRVVLQKMLDLAQAAGGPPPLPAPPDAAHVTQLQLLSGNEQFAAAHAQRAALLADFREWERLNRLKSARLPQWQKLNSLMPHAHALPAAAPIEAQMTAITQERALLAEPDPIKPLLDALTAALRQALQTARQNLENARQQELAALEKTAEWQQLPDETWKSLFHSHQLGPIPPLQLGDDDQLLRALNARSLAAWRTEVDALPTRIREAREAAARQLAPQAQQVRPKSTTLRTPAEVDAYLADLRQEIMQHITNGRPVIV